MADFMQYLPAVSTALQATGQIAGGIQARRMAGAESDQLRYFAGQERASGQRQAAEERRQAGLVQSSLRARAMGGGGDAGVLDLYGDIAGEGEYRALSALYEADSRAVGMENRAAMRRYEGGQAQSAGLLKGASTIIDAGPSLYEKYGGGGYRGDADGYRYSRTGADIRGRR